MSGFGQASPILGAAAGGTFGIALALLNCFFGYQLKKVWIALGCFALGGALGAGLGALLFQGNLLAWAGVALLLGVVFACLSFKLYLGGIFVLCFMLGWVITLPFLKLYGGGGRPGMCGCRSDAGSVGNQICQAGADSGNSRGRRPFGGARAGGDSGRVFAGNRFGRGVAGGGPCAGRPWRGLPV